MKWEESILKIKEEIGRIEEEENEANKFIKESVEAYLFELLGYNS